MRVSALPFDPGPAVWKELTGGMTNYPILEENISVDFAVVGAGFAGLAAARRLQQLDPSFSVAVVEARQNL